MNPLKPFICSAQILSSCSLALVELLNKRHVCVLSHVRFFVTPHAVGHQAPLSMGFPRQEYWSGLTFLSLGDVPDSGIKPGSPAWQMDSLPLSCLGTPR